ncbi:MAG: glycosyltransferase family 4 protein [Planctomycetes bacterium]|nr:glycosyltransferase family 4 protein [Planctomycetota bacterium]
MIGFKQNSILLIGSYVPRQCGIATFTHDLATSVAEHVHGVPLKSAPSVGIVAMNDLDDTYAYGPEVLVQIGQHRREDYRTAAEILNTSRVDVVSLQHEYGLFGGECGEYLLDLLQRLRKPVVSTLHTVLTEPSPKQKDVLQKICARSSVVVVMANRARMILNEIYGVPMERIRLIHHGVPDVPFGETEPFKERFGLEGRPVILTFGLLSPSKGIETMLDALADIIPDFPNVAYIVLGVTHPGVKRESGELYRLSLERRAVELGIQENVLFHNRYVSNDDLREYLQAADVYVTPYRAREQITSGTLAYALASGRAIISTPYWHAQELLAGGRGRLADFGQAKEFSMHLTELLGDDKKRTDVRRAAYDFGRAMVWPSVAAQYAESFAHAQATFAESGRDLVAERKVLMRMSLPEIHLDHLLTMTDDTGLLQHAVFATPDRNHGYCVDDNARGLIVASMVWSLFQDDRILQPLHVYLAFLHYAQNADTGRFRNFMSYDRRWLEDDGSDDCQGRALWSLGYLISHAPKPSAGQLALKLFRKALDCIPTLNYPRSWAFAILGLHYYLRENTDDNDARKRMSELAEKLNRMFVENEGDDWPWMEETVTYDNGRLPQALIVAGTVLERQELVDRGLHLLEWLFDIQTAKGGHLSIIGNDGWMPRNGVRAPFDQQALEPAALIGACKAAYRASGNTKWLVEMRRCFEWYVGRNDIGRAMIDFKSRGCYDGLSAEGINENQGAESVLSWLLSLLIMHEMQTGDAPEVG